MFNSYWLILAIAIIIAVIIQISTAYQFHPYAFNIKKSLLAGETILLSMSYLKIGSNNFYSEDGWFFITTKRFLVRSKNTQDNISIPISEINTTLNNSEKLFAYTKNILFTGWENQTYITITGPNFSIPMKLRGWDSKYRLNSYERGFAGDHTYLGLFLMIQKLHTGNSNIQNELDIMYNKKPIINNIELAQNIFHNLLICKEQA
jgi:hypothetical protein